MVKRKTEEKLSEKSAAVEAPIFLLDTKTRPLLEPLMEELNSIGATLSVSDIVLYEVLKAIVFDPEKVQPVAEFIDNYLTRYLVDDTVLIGAARVHEMYGNEKSTKQYRDKFSTEDIVIATTSMLTGSYIITSDCNDYPAPFFIEVNRQTFYYEEGNRRKHLIIHILQPDQEVINDTFNQLQRMSNR